MTGLSEPLSFLRGPCMENRLMLAPMTSDQATPEGLVTDDELRWLGMRARGGFGLVMTSAAYVRPDGKAGEGQFGIFSDDHIEGYACLAIRPCSTVTGSIVTPMRRNKASTWRPASAPSWPSTTIDSSTKVATLIEQVSAPWINSANRIRSGSP